MLSSHSTSIIIRRMVYIELEDGADLKTVEAAILADDYFAHDETHVIAVESVDALNNVAHGVKTMIELAPIDLLPGTTEQLVKALV